MYCRCKSQNCNYWHIICDNPLLLKLPYSPPPSLREKFLNETLDVYLLLTLSCLFNKKNDLRREELFWIASLTLTLAKPSIYWWSSANVFNITICKHADCTMVTLSSSPHLETGLLKPPSTKRSMLSINHFCNKLASPQLSICMVKIIIKNKGQQQQQQQ